MNKYELTVIIDGEATPAKRKTFEGKMEKAITAFKGKISKFEEWGKKELAYIIKKSNTGIYLHYQLELERQAAKDFSRKLSIDDSVLRHLIIRKDK